MRRSVVVLVLLVIATGACGGSGSGGAPGRLVESQDSGSLCLPAGERLLAMFGEDVLRNDGDGDVVLREAALVGARDLSLVKAFVTPLHGKPAIGSQPDYPPTGLRGSVLRNWRERKRFEGATVGAGETVGLIVVVRSARDDGTGSARTIRIRYEAGSKGSPHTWTGVTSFELKPSCI